MNYRIDRKEYRLLEAPTEQQRRDLEECNEQYGKTVGIRLSYREKMVRRDTWYGPRDLPAWFLVVEFDPSRSGAKRPPEGRPPKILPPARVILQRQMEGRSMAAMAKEYGVSRVTLYRHLSRENAQNPPENDSNTPGNVV